MLQPRPLWELRLLQPLVHLMKPQTWLNLVLAQKALPPATLWNLLMPKQLATLSWKTKSCRASHKSWHQS